MKPTDRAAPLPPPLQRQDPPFIVAGNVPIPRREAFHVEDAADGCGCLLAVILVGALVCLAAILGSGCTPRYTVIPADREVVPIRQTVSDESTKRKTYIEDDAGATGWYVPDAVLLDLLTEPQD